MKKLLFSLCLLALTASAVNPVVSNSYKYFGNYSAVLLPLGSCSNERLILTLNVAANATLTGKVSKWDGTTVLDFASDYPNFDQGKFSSDPSGVADRVRGTFTTGQCSGTVTIVAGCSYSFKAFRRYQLAQ